jgi:putative addiction module component (TIGR02574 family)
MKTEEIEQELLKLPLAERARLAERLIASLDEDAEIEAAWIAEVRRRDEELVSGAVEAIPLEDALTSIRTRFGW